MKTEATFTINIQPACLWNINANERLTSKPIMGTVSSLFYRYYYIFYLLFKAVAF